MAITAVISLKSSIIVAGERASGLLTVSNSGASAVNVTSIDGDVYPVGATSGTAQVPFVMGNFQPGLTSVPAAGSAIFHFRTAIFSPQSPGSTQQGFTLSVIVYTDDGAVTTASGATTVYCVPPNGTGATGTVPTAGSFRGDNNASSPAFLLLGMP